MNKKVLLNLCLTAGSCIYSVLIFSAPEVRGMSWERSMVSGQTVPSPPLHQSKAREIMGMIDEPGPRLESQERTKGDV